MKLDKEMKVMDITSTANGRKKVEKKIKALATKRLPFTRIMDVKVKPDVDFDGDPILNVDILHDSADGLGGRTYGFRTILHEALDEMGYTGYPVTSFIWHKEYEDYA